MALPTDIQTFIDRQADSAPANYDDLRAVIFNGTLKRSPEPSHTDGLLAIARGIFARTGVTADEVRTVDHEIPPGVWPDMREHGYERDDFPAIYRELVAPADIILIAGPIWLGDQSSQTRKIIERLYAYSSEVNAAGQWSYYGKVGGVADDRQRGRRQARQRPGPLRAAAHRPDRSSAVRRVLGRRGRPGTVLPRRGGRRARRNAWTTRNTVFMTWNLLHLARMLKDAGGIPAYGNSTHDWDLGHPEHPNPEYR